VGFASRSGVKIRTFLDHQTGISNIHVGIEGLCKKIPCGNNFQRVEISRETSREESWILGGYTGR